MDERSTDRIEQDIERTRADMSETIEALERKLSPGELIDELWGRVRSGETGSNVADTIRDHPIPLAMMGLGLGWLAIEKATESRTDQLRARHGEYGAGTYERAEGRVGPYRGDEVIDPDLRYDDGPGATDRIRDAAGTVKDRVADLAGEAKDRLASMGDSVRDRTSSTGHSANEHVYGIGGGAAGSDGASRYGQGSGPGIRDRATDLRESAGREMHDRGRQMERGLQRMLEDYPLALGAVTFGLGLAAGLSVPSTPAENRVMGDTADTLKGEVKRTARETAEMAKDVAGEAARAAKTEADREGMGDDLRAKAERVIGAARETARTESENRGLTADAMQDRAREIGEKTAETAKERREGES
jgi:hypothetical protein